MPLLNEDLECDLLVLKSHKQLQFLQAGDDSALCRYIEQMGLLSARSRRIFLYWTLCEC